MSSLDSNKGIGFFYNFFVEKECNFRGGSLNYIFDSAFFGENVIVLSLMFEHFEQLFGCHEVINYDNVFA